MTAEVIILDDPAIIENGVWDSENENLAKLLNIMTQQFLLQNQDYLPDKDYAIATAMIKEFPHSKLISHEDNEELEPGAIY